VSLPDGEEDEEEDEEEEADDGEEEADDGEKSGKAAKPRPKSRWR